MKKCTAKVVCFAVCAALGMAFTSTSGQGTLSVVAEKSFLDPALDSASKIVADQKLQKMFSQIAASLVPPDGTPPDPKVTATAMMELEKQRELQADYEIARQLFVFTVQHGPGTGGSIAEQAVVSVVIRGLAWDLKPNALLEAVAPFANAEDPGSRFIVDRIVLPIAEASDHGNSDRTSAYQEFIESCSDDHLPLPEGIIELMFLRQPNKSLLACERVYIRQNHEREQLVLTAHAMDNYLWQREFSARYDKPAPASTEAIKVLAPLASDDHWWSRLYVAALLRQYPELRDAAIMKSLQTDGGKLVKRAVTLIDVKSNPIAAPGSAKPPTGVREPIGDPSNRPPGGPFRQ